MPVLDNPPVGIDQPLISPEAGGSGDLSRAIKEHRARRAMVRLAIETVLSLYLEDQKLLQPEVLPDTSTTEYKSLTTVRHNQMLTIARLLGCTDFDDVISDIDDDVGDAIAAQKFANMEQLVQHTLSSLTDEFQTIVDKLRMKGYTPDKAAA
ncbi:MAG: hypothetical protein G01um101425_429 [Candidatus Peregrinibacteria bacterium Gr01-1014_25]|nr:MAG: hypothetical protein G01um101425_429 [Candidatus Peregrinibacteria bacterium Gr01-1014_25]